MFTKSDDCFTQHFSTTQVKADGQSTTAGGSCQNSLPGGTKGPYHRHKTSLINLLGDDENVEPLDMVSEMRNAHICCMNDTVYQYFLSLL